MLVSPLSEIAITNNDVMLMKNLLTKRLKKQERKKTKMTNKPIINEGGGGGGTSTAVFKTPSLPMYAATSSASSASPSTQDIMSTCTPTINNVINSDFATPTSSSSSTIIFGKTRANSIKRAIQ
ncbi:unnamed protein product [Auanema sp. JU1783]|nr:unnamed protein product [Auanema sp. JU1783]